MLKRALYLISFIIIFAGELYASYDTLWTKMYGGYAGDFCLSAIETKDGNILMAGHTSSYGSGALDYYLIKINLDGDTLWTKTIGGGGYDYPHQIIETSDSNLLLIGSTTSFAQTNYDFWLMKVDQLGDTIFTKSYDNGYLDDIGYSVTELQDGNIIFLGSTSDPLEMRLYKTSSIGDTIWTERLRDYYGYYIDRNSKGNLVVCGYKKVASLTQGFMLELNQNGIIQDVEEFDSLIFRSFAITPDGGYAVAGFGPVPGTSYNTIVRLDSNFNNVWREPGTQTESDARPSIKMTCDGGFILASHEAGNYAYAFKVSGSGLWQWENFIDTYWSRYCSAIVTSDDQIFLCGYAHHPVDDYQIYLTKIVENYLCGDANRDGHINVSDAVFIINYVFVGGNAPCPISSGDCNCDGSANISDAVWIINYVFVGGNAPCDTNGDGIPDC